jgi:hypothetical protein
MILLRWKTFWWRRIIDYLFRCWTFAFIGEWIDYITSWYWSSIDYWSRRWDWFVLETSTNNFQFQSIDWNLITHSIRFVRRSTSCDNPVPRKSECTITWNSPKGKKTNITQPHYHDITITNNFPSNSTHKTSTFTKNIVVSLFVFFFVFPI